MGGSGGATAYGSPAIWSGSSTARTLPPVAARLEAVGMARDDAPATGRRTLPGRYADGSMERIVVVGNCQAIALELMLSTNVALKERFEFVRFPAAHEIPDEMVPEVHEAVAGAAVLVAQRIDEGYRDGIGLGTETLASIAAHATVVRWPSVYWPGYVPDLFYLRDAAGGPVVDGPFDYHDRVVLESYGSGNDVATTCRLLEDPGRPSDAPARAAAATAELDLRGKDCDVQVTSFIASRFREELLFFTMNHPSNRTIAYISEQITQLLGIPGGVDERQLPSEMLGSTVYPLHANHVRALGLRFGASMAAGRIPFKVRGVEHSATEAVQAFFTYYDEHPALVELNLARSAA